MLSKSVVEFRQNMTFLKTLEDIGIPKITGQIYTQLLENTKLSARQLANNLGISRPSVYDHLKTLMKESLVSEMTEEGKTFFVATDKKSLTRFVDDKLEKLSASKKAIEKELAKMHTKKDSVEPRIQFFSGVDGLKNVLQDMLWRENIETLTMWPISDMVKILGKEYLENLNRKRIRNKISIRGIWPKDKAVKFKEYPFLGVGSKHLRELRFAPKGMTWNMSYWQYEDKVAFISSSNECFGFIVQSRDFVSLIKANFEAVWAIAKPIPAEPKYTDLFIKTITN